MSCSACRKQPASNRLRCFRKRRRRVLLLAAKISDEFEDCQHQQRLRDEADCEGQCAEHGYAQRVDHDMRKARPEIKRAGKRGRAGSDAQRPRGQNERRKTTRFSTALVCAASKRCAQADCGLSFGLGLAIAAMRPRTMMRSRMSGPRAGPSSLWSVRARTVQWTWSPPYLRSIPD